MIAKTSARSRDICTGSRDICTEQRHLHGAGDIECTEQQPEQADGEGHRGAPSPRRPRAARRSTGRRSSWPPRGRGCRRAGRRAPTSRATRYQRVPSALRSEQKPLTRAGEGGAATQSGFAGTASGRTPNSAALRNVAQWVVKEGSTTTIEGGNCPAGVDRAVLHCSIH